MTRNESRTVLKASGGPRDLSLSQRLMEPSFDPTVFTKNRKRLLEHAVARQFFDAVVRRRMVWDC